MPIKNGPIMTQPVASPAFNVEVKRLLAEAVKICAACATSAESVKYSDNPRWLEVVKVLDDCTDTMRTLEQTL